MEALISSVCSTLVILALCQVIVETILPEGGTKRYVLFLTGLVAVAVIVTSFALSGPEILKTIYARSAGMRDAADRHSTEQRDAGQGNPYRQYIEKLIESYR